jgi:hypothetical protein
MATNEMQGALLLHEVSEDSGITWKTLVCEQAGRVRSNTNVTTEKTKCGPIKGIDSPDWSMSGDGVANFATSVDQVSLTDIMRYIQNTIKVRMRVRSPAAGSYAIGEQYYREGEGYFSTNEEDIGNGAVVKFSWEFEGEGKLATTLLAVAALTTPINQATGSTITINSVASGGSAPYTYQWKKNAVNIGGATSASFVKVSSTSADNGSYTVLVTDAGNNTKLSSAAVVTIT